MTNGREAKYNVFVTSTGAEIQHRVLSPDVLPRLLQACQTELADERPQPPTQEVAVGPGQTEHIENPHDDAYIAALREWEQMVVALRGVKLKALMEEYALIYEVDYDAVREYREAMQAVGVDLSDESDKALYLWHLTIPDPLDVGVLIGALSGKRVEQAVRDQTDLFLRSLPGSAVNGVETAG